MQGAGLFINDRFANLYSGKYVRTNNDIIVIQPNNKPEKAFDEDSLKDIEIQKSN